ncbi:MAG: glycosyltransferase [Bacteroidota bacterium]|nr:glycosyltransferase [Bacteroidota bacterium]
MINRVEKDIITSWKGTVNQPLISICCITYNHEAYIKEALNGFLMQETNFPFEVLINDDFSKDNTTDIIKEYVKKYPNILKAIYQTENQYSQGVKINPTFNYPRVQGKYIAICEGDDYWIDKNKLQKQVDFLEEHHNYGLCYTKAKVYIQEKKKYAKRCFGFEIPLRGLLFNNSIPTLTVICRKDLVLRYLDEVQEYSQTWKMGDYPMWIWFNLNSKIYFLKETTAVYRLSGDSMSQRNNGKKRLLFLENSFDIANFFAKKTLGGSDYQEFLIVKYLGLYNESIKENTTHYKDYLIKLNNIKHKGWKIKIYLFFLEVLGLRKLLTLAFKFRNY